MRRVAPLLVLAMFCSISAFAQTSLGGLSPKDAKSMGMGGYFRVFATGYNAFFGNPAGFEGPGSFTLADVAAWAYLKPRPLNIKNLKEIADGTVSRAEAEQILGNLVDQNGLGVGASAGLGWSGNGFGLGITVISDALATGSSYGDSIVDVKNQANATFGLACPLSLGPLKFKVGADVRAFYRLDSPAVGWNFGTLATALLDRQGFSALIEPEALTGGYGFAVDAGATMELGPLVAGFMVRDFGCRFYMDSTTVGDIANGVIPFDGTDLYALAPVYTAGIGLRFKNSDVISSSIYLEADDPLSLIPYFSTDIGAVPGLIHAGAELKFWNFLFLRAGFNKGLLSVGAGVDLAIFEVDAALFTEESTSASLGAGRAGIALQAAVRF